MDFLSTKALNIAVGVAISLSITSAILFTLNQITLIYQGVYNTDVSIKKQFSEYAMYEGTTMTGLEMYNAANRYKDSKEINVRNHLSSGTNINTTNWINYVYNPSNDIYTKNLYKVSCTTDINGIITIFFDGR